MAAEDEGRTEEATPKKIEKAREEGNVPNSREVSNFVPALVGIVAIFAMSSYAFEQIVILFKYYMSLMSREITPNALMEILIITLLKVTLIVAPIILPILLAGLFAHWAQFGFLWTTKKLFDFDISRFMNFAALNFFSMQKLFETAKILFKSVLTLTIGAAVFWQDLKELPTVALFPLVDQLKWLENRAMVLIASVMLLFLILAIIDLFWTRYQYSEQLKMTKQEVKDEFKNMEGSPEIKRKIRELQFKMFKKRMMSSIKDASVVVTNPTHYAVALRYKQGEDKAPVVVASGVDFMALKIKEIAYEHEIPVIENPPLARELYAKTKVDQVIPQELYQAVIEVLVMIMRTKQ